MTHEDAGKYRAKHPPGTTCDPAIAAALEKRTKGGSVPCAVAHEVAGALGVAPAEVGVTTDLLEYRIVRCQLGLFGHEPQGKIVRAAADVSDDLRDRLRASATPLGIACSSCWHIAESLGIAKMETAAACEHLGIKIRPCQLGAF